MDEINTNAIAGLTLAVEELLTEGLPGGTLQPPVAIVPLKFSPVGIGGYVATHPDLAKPIGDIVGRRLEASVLVMVEDTVPANLAATAVTVAQVLVGASRSDREQRGILRLEYHPTAVDSSALERELEFRVLYEYLHIPTEAGETIETIPTTLAIGVGGNNGS